MKKYILIFLISICFGQFRDIEIDAITHFFDADADSTVQTLNSSSGFLLMVEVQNLNLSDAWFHLYDAVLCTVGTTVPSMSIHVPGGDGTAYYGSKIVNFQFTGLVFENAIKYACTDSVSGGLDPTNGLIVNAQYFDD